MFKKLFFFLRIHWLTIIFAAFCLGIALSGTLFVIYAWGSFVTLEAFSQRQIIAQYGIMAIIFIYVALFQVPLSLGIYYYFFVMGGMVGNLKISKEKTQVSMDEVIGMEDAKREAMELVKLLKDRSLLKVIGGKIIKGTIMFGPPGCGKTYLAKAIATECELPFLPAVGSDFMGMFVGQGTARMKSLFGQARALAKLEGGCIIFIDEIDSFARPRGADMGFGGGRMDLNATINQFLTEMDGLRKAENNLVVIAATNVTENDLDPAIMRAGRFDRKIYVTLPNLDERKKLFNFYLSRVETESAIDTQLLARKALYFSPSDIDNMVREAGLVALRRHSHLITLKDLHEAYDRVSFGLKSNTIMTPTEKLWTAYHEAGHAVIAYLLHPTNDVIKASIVPHKGMLGFISQRPTVEMHGATREILLANIQVSVASYVAERLKFGSTSSGVGGGRSSDFGQALQTARTMVWRYGMGASGLVGDFESLTGQWGQLPISPKTIETLDHDVQKILQDCIADVEKTLGQHRPLFEEFAQRLLTKEDLEYDEIVAIFDQFNLKPASRPAA